MVGWSTVHGQLFFPSEYCPHWFRQFPIQTALQFILSIILYKYTHAFNEMVYRKGDCPEILMDIQLLLRPSPCIPLREICWINRYPIIHYDFLYNLPIQNSVIIVFFLLSLNPTKSCSIATLILLATSLSWFTNPFLILFPSTSNLCCSLQCSSHSAPQQPS